MLERAIKIIAHTIIIESPKLINIKIIGFNKSSNRKKERTNPFSNTFPDNDGIGLITRLRVEDSRI
jgi:hypothetical protein